jgi:hypothetical protein
MKASKREYPLDQDLSTAADVEHKSLTAEEIILSYLGKTAKMSRYNTDNNFLLQAGAGASAGTVYDVDNATGIHSFTLNGVQKATITSLGLQLNNISNLSNLMWYDGYVQSSANLIWNNTTHVLTHEKGVSASNSVFVNYKQRVSNNSSIKFSQYLTGGSLVDIAEYIHSMSDQTAGNYGNLDFQLYHANAGPGSYLKLGNNEAVLHGYQANVAGGWVNGTGYTDKLWIKSLFGGSNKRALRLTASEGDINSGMSSEFLVKDTTAYGFFFQRGHYQGDGGTAWSLRYSINRLGDAFFNGTLTTGGSISTTGYIGIGITPPIYPLDIESAVGNVNSKFGSKYPVYVMSDNSTGATGVGLNAYYNAGWKYGKGSPSAYAAMMVLSSTGGIEFRTTAAVGAADGAITWNPGVYINRSGGIGIGTQTLDSGAKFQIWEPSAATAAVISSGTSSAVVNVIRGGTGATAGLQLINGATHCWYLQMRNESGNHFHIYNFVQAKTALYVKQSNSYIAIGGHNDPNFILDVENGSENKGSSKFGTNYPIYLGNNANPSVGFTAYYDAGWKFGKNPTSSYAGLIEQAATTGLMQFYISSAAGATGATLTFPSVQMTLSKDGNLSLSGALSVQRAANIGDNLGSETTFSINPVTVGPTLVVRTASGSYGNGSSISLGAQASQFAALKAFYTDGSGNGVGDLAISLRSSTASQSLSPVMIFRQNGNVEVTGAATIGGSIFSSNGQIRATSSNSAGTYIEIGKYANDLIADGVPYPVIKTDNGYIYFAAGGKYSGALGWNGTSNIFALKDSAGADDLVHLEAANPSWFTKPMSIGTSTTVSSVTLTLKSMTANGSIIIGRDEANAEKFALNLEGGIPTFYDKYNGNWVTSLYLKAGSVGIGTNNPLYTLHVNGSFYASSIALSGSIDTGTLGDTPGDFRGIFGKMASNDYWYVGGRVGSGVNDGHLLIATGDDGNEPIVFCGSQPAPLLSNLIEWARINQNGFNVQAKGSNLSYSTNISNMKGILLSGRTDSVSHYSSIYYTTAGIGGGAAISFSGRADIRNTSIVFWTNHSAAVNQGDLRYVGEFDSNGQFYTEYNAYINGQFSAISGSKIVIQNSQDGGVGRGIYMWLSADSNWAIYMGQAGGTRSLSGAAACSSLSGRTSHMFRFRINNNSTNAFVWENSSENCLMSLDADTGFFQTRAGATFGGNTFVNGELRIGSSGSHKHRVNGGRYINDDSTSLKILHDDGTTSIAAFSYYGSTISSSLIAATFEVPFGGQIKSTSNSQDGTQSSDAGLVVYGRSTGTEPSTVCGPAFMTFHRPGKYAGQFGLDDGVNKFYYGGWSFGAVKYYLFSTGNLPTAAQVSSGTFSGSFSFDSLLYANGGSRITGSLEMREAGVGIISMLHRDSAIEVLGKLAVDTTGGGYDTRISLYPSSYGINPGDAVAGIGSIGFSSSSGGSETERIRFLFSSTQLAGTWKGQDGGYIMEYRGTVGSLPVDGKQGQMVRYSGKLYFYDGGWQAEY